MVEMAERALRIPVSLGGAEHMLTRAEWDKLVSRVEGAWASLRAGDRFNVRVARDIEAHPGTSSAEIAARLGAKPNNVAVWISRWKLRGLVRTETRPVPARRGRREFSIWMVKPIRWASDLAVRVETSKLRRVRLLNEGGGSDG